MQIVINLLVMALAYALGYFSSRFFTKKWAMKERTKIDGKESKK